jgi:DNA-binding Lrp family transcriptional regulator
MLDETDKRMLDILVENSRLSLRQIAKKAGYSVATIMNRLRNLEKKKIIKKYTTNMDYEKVGYGLDVMIEIKISKGILLEVEQKLAASPNVFAVYDITGPFDTLVLARFPTRRRLDAFVKKIQKYPHVEKTETRLILDTIKEEEMGLGGL